MGGVHRRCEWAVRVGGVNGTCGVQPRPCFSTFAGGPQSSEMSSPRAVWPGLSAWFLYIHTLRTSSDKASIVV